MIQDTDCEYERWGARKMEDGSYVVCKNTFSQSEAGINIGINGFDDLGC